MFKDRKDAGHKLFKLVSQYKHEIDLVLAIPRGGIEVGMSIAQDLGKPLQMVTAKKIGAPHNSEVAIGLSFTVTTARMARRIEKYPYKSQISAIFYVYLVVL